MALALSAAADSVRGPLPRTVPERTARDALHRRAAAELPAPARTAALTTGTGLDAARAAAMLDALAGRMGASLAD